MYRVFGWINVALVILMILPFLVRWLNTRYIKNDMLKKQLNKYRFMHKVFGALLLASIVTHAILALGTWQWHTGTILGISAVLAVIAAILFYTFKKKWLFILHRVLAVILIALLLVHLIFPSAIYYIFG